MKNPTKIYRITLCQMQRIKETQNPAKVTCSKSTMETPEKDVKYAQS